MYTESQREMIAGCHALFRQKKRRRDVGADRIADSIVARILADRRWREAEEREDWERGLA